MGEPDIPEISSVAAAVAAAAADALFRYIARSVLGCRHARLRLRTAYSRPPFLRNIPTK